MLKCANEIAARKSLALKFLPVFRKPVSQKLTTSEDKILIFLRKAAPNRTKKSLPCRKEVLLDRNTNKAIWKPTVPTELE